MPSGSARSVQVSPRSVDPNSRTDATSAQTTVADGALNCVFVGSGIGDGDVRVDDGVAVGAAVAVGTAVGIDVGTGAVALEHETAARTINTEATRTTSVCSQLPDEGRECLERPLG